MTDKMQSTTVIWSQGNRFEIGGENILPPAPMPEVGETNTEAATADQERFTEAIADIRIQVGTLLKTETVSVLLGAGASVECGGQLIGSIPLAVELTLLSEGIGGSSQPRLRRWLRVFYLAVRRAGKVEDIPITRDAILERREALTQGGAEPLRVNFEQVLALMHRWRAAIPESGGRLRIDGSPPVDVRGEVLDDCLSHTTLALARACDLPTEGKKRGLGGIKMLLGKLLTRPLNLKRLNIFTLNYDTLVEQASDAEGIVLLDGFVGTHRRIFRPENYEQDLYFPAETTEGRVHRFDRVLHLYKLHGSISWVAEALTVGNPYGIVAKLFDADRTRPLLIYPTPAKYGETLGMPYSELFRRFASALVRPQSVLFVIGYGFGDDHVNAIIRQALAVPSFTLVIVDPKPGSDFVTKLRGQNDRRVWIAEGNTLGTLSGFVEQLLPDLRDEEIRKKVLATHRALAKGGQSEVETSDGN